MELSAARCALVVGVAAALVIVALAILPFLTPSGSASSRIAPRRRRGPASRRGRPPDGHRRDPRRPRPRAAATSTSRSTACRCSNERERQHMRDVARRVRRFFLRRGRSALRPRRGVPARAAGRGPGACSGGACRRAGRVIAVVTVVGGIVGVLFFDRRSSCSTSCSSRPGSFTVRPGDRAASSSCSRSRSGSRRRSRSGS